MNIIKKIILVFVLILFGCTLNLYANNDYGGKFELKKNTLDKNGQFEVILKCKWKKDIMIVTSKIFYSDNNIELVYVKPGTGFMDMCQFDPDTNVLKSSRDILLFGTSKDKEYLECECLFGFKVKDSIKVGDTINIYTDKIMLEDINDTDEAYPEASISFKLGRNNDLVFGELSEEEKTLSKIEIKSNPSKTVYTEGEMVDISGLKIYAVYSDGSSSDVTSKITVTPDRALTKDDKAVTITYIENGVPQIATFNITVNAKEDDQSGDEKKLSKIEIINNPSKTEYIEGEKFDASGLKISAVYEDGSSFDVTSKITVTPNRALTKDDKVVTITYAEGGVTKIVTFNITVKEKTSPIPAIKTDTTTAQVTNLPKTGLEKYIIKVMIVIVCLVAIIMFVNYKNINKIVK